MYEGLKRKTRETDATLAEYVQRRESNPRDALLQLYLTERNCVAVIKLNIIHRNANFLIGFLTAKTTFFSAVRAC